MTTVFIGGSRRINRVTAELTPRLDNIMHNALRVIVGDANGFDRAAQTYFAEHAYRSVLVYCTNGHCRNNVGEWPTQTVEFQGRDRNREFYTAKDDAMLRDAEYGLFAWDGKSKGTLRNICRMAELGKPSAVYVSGVRRVVTVRNPEDAALLAQSGTSNSPPPNLFSDSTPTGSRRLPA